MTGNKAGRRSKCNKERLKQNSGTRNLKFNVRESRNADNLNIAFDVSKTQPKLNARETWYS